MYTIKEAALRAGVSVALLRAWERRYGIVTPGRTEAGYRLYSDDEVALLRSMRRLVDVGWSPSAAAASLVRDAGDSAAAALLDERALGPDRASGARPGDLAAQSAEAAELGERFIEAATSLEPAEVAAVLDEMLSRGSFERVASTLVIPALRALGDAWAAGQVSVAAEHVASHAVLRRLAGAFEAAGTPRSDDRPVVVGLPPGSRHELGALMFAVAARRAGLPVLYVGADLPADAWLSATASAAAAVIGVVTAADRAAAGEVATVLRRDRPALIVALGGPAASAVPGALVLPDDLSAAVDRLAAAVRGGSLSG